MDQPSPTLNTTAVPSNDITSQSHTYTYYHAGPLFTVSELHTNTLLSTLIHNISQQKYIPLLPQDLEQRSLHPHAIRDTDIRALLNCDLALFTYDGSEIDSGTVVEYMIAKFADIPSVIVRTDFRTSGDQGSTNLADGEGSAAAAEQMDAWNLMSSFWPRTRVVRVDSIVGYKTNLASVLERDQSGGLTRVGGNRQASSMLLEQVAGQCVEAMDEVLNVPPRLPEGLREGVYEWLALMPGFRDGNMADMRRLMGKKVEKRLL